MRISLIIIALAAIAVGLVHIRRGQLAVRCERQRLQSQHTRLRREIWDRQVKIGHMMTPQAVRFRSEVLALEMTSEPPAGRRAPGD